MSRPDQHSHSRFGFAHLRFQVRVRVFENDDGLAFLSCDPGHSVNRNRLVRFGSTIICKIRLVLN
jgi:hypothetical protein